jgi:hypothetical protein
MNGCHRLGRHVRFIAALLGVACVFCTTAAELRAQSVVGVEAYVGQPFGVGRIVLQSGNGIRVKGIPRPGGGRIADLARRVVEQGGNPPGPNLKFEELAITETNGRVYYPVFEKRERPILQEFVAVPTQRAFLFLFQGDGPLELTVYTPAGQPIRISPRRDAQGHERLLRAWWGDFAVAADGRDVPKEFPPIVEEYLTDTLASRLRLAVPERAAPAGGLFQSQFNLLLGTESARQEMSRSILLGQQAQEQATEVLPEELPLPKPELLDPPQADVEPIAMHVPVECLYVRFGSFPNFLWLRHRTDEWGGQLRDVISERGMDYGMNERMQRQLGLHESALAELLGERVIADVAMIGTDTFLREGAAIGMLFQAKSTAALTADLTQQRLTSLNSLKNGKQEKLTIADHSVSLFSTADNTMRSFYVADGDFHLVTTSRKIVEWFLATGAGKHEALGASDEFRYARKRMPLDRNDTVFAYLSPQFFQNLLSAHYQVELSRRLRSAVEIELFRIAQLAARGEGRPGDTIEELVASGMLPQNFGIRPDGSRLEVIDGNLGDSLRGGRGTFLPVPDVPIEKITPSEARNYQQLASTYVTDFGPMDPVMAAVKREALSSDLEKVTLDVEAAPLSQQHREMLSRWLGPPTDQRLAPVSGDVAAFEAVLRGGSFFSGGDHHLFGALRDADPALASDTRTSLISRIFISRLGLEGLQGYLGAWPNAGYLRLLGGDSNLPPDASGFSALRTGLWRRQLNDFTLLSFQPQVLAVVSPQLRFEKAPRPAQIWFRADDLRDSKLAPMINAFGYRQSRTISQGNARFMNMLVEQLHVPPAEALETAEALLDAELIDPLGGKYELQDLGGGLKNWTSTALVATRGSTAPPADYQFPALNWLRGIQLEVRADAGLLALHGEVIMPVETKPAAAGFQLPSFFGGGAQKPAEPPKKPKPAPTPARPKPAGPREF